METKYWCGQKFRLFNEVVEIVMLDSECKTETYALTNNIKPFNNGSNWVDDSFLDKLEQI